MKNIYKLFLFIAIGVIYTSCDDRELATLNASSNSTLTLSETNIVLSDFSAGDNVLTASWTEPDFGYDAVGKYKIFIDFASGDFSNAQVIVLDNSFEKTFTKEELNSKLLSLSATTGLSSEFKFIVETELSAYSKTLSDPVSITITPYASILDLSTTWGVVGSATPNGWDGPDLPFFQTGEAGVSVAYVTLSDGEIKFRENNDWANNYGDDGTDNTLEAGGANIAVASGSYKIILNLNDLTYTMTSFSWGLVGNATPNGWDGPDVLMKYDEYSNTFKAIVTLTSGEMKFRQNNAWDVNYGDTGADGTLENGGDNITVTAGSYLITLNFIDSENPFYTMEETMIWGLVGSATPNGWDGPDTKFTRDFSSNEEHWVIESITLTDGDMKIRHNDSWDINYGDDGNDGSLEMSGANIPVTAGTYKIKIDFSDSDNPIYTKE